MHVSDLRFGNATYGSFFSEGLRYTDGSFNLTLNFTDLTWSMCGDVPAHQYSTLFQICNTTTAVMSHCLGSTIAGTMPFDFLACPAVQHYVMRIIARTGFPFSLPSPLRLTTPTTPISIPSESFLISWCGRVSSYVSDDLLTAACGATVTAGRCVGEAVSSVTYPFSGVITFVVDWMQCPTVQRVIQDVTFRILMKLNGM